MLFEQIKADQLQARKDKKTVEVALLTTLIGEGSTQAKNKGVETLTDADTVTLVNKFLKNNADYIAMAGEHVPPEVYEEKAVLERYRPKQLSEDQISTILQENGLTTNKGEAMKFLKANYAGQYDGKLATKVFEQLAG